MRRGWRRRAIYLRSIGFGQRRWPMRGDGGAPLGYLAYTRLFEQVGMSITPPFDIYQLTRSLQY
jgi:hypothetical protein